MDKFPAIVIEIIYKRARIISHTMYENKRKRNQPNKFAMRICVCWLRNFPFIGEILQICPRIFFINQFSTVN